MMTHPEYIPPSQYIPRIIPVGFWLLSLLCFVLFVIVLLRFAPIRLGHTLFEMSLYTAPVWLACSALFLSWITRHSILKGGRVISVIIAAWLGLCFCDNLLCIGNAVFDASPAQVHPASIVSKYIYDRRKHGKYGYTYFVRYENPVSLQTTNFSKYRVSYDEYQKIVPGRTRVELLTGQGWLGFSWLRSIRLDFDQPGNASDAGTGISR